MSTTMRMAGQRERPAADCGELAAELFPLLRALRDLAPPGARWSILSRAFEPKLVYTIIDLVKPLVASRPVRRGDVPSGAPTHRAVLTCAAGKTALLHLSLGFSIAGAPAASVGVRAELTVEGAVFEDVASPAERAVAMFRTFVAGLGLDVARATSGAASLSLAAGRAVRLGFLTYLPARLGPLPELPPDCEAAALDGSGWILVAHPGLPRPGSKEQDVALASLRFALGARVLLDGPSFPHPSLGPAPPAPPAPIDTTPRPAPVNLPSYLRGEAVVQEPSPAAAPAMAKAPPAQVGAPVMAVAPQGPAAAPAFDTGTADLSPDILRRIAVPFAAGPPAGGQKAIPPAAPAEPPPAEGSQPRSGLTEDVDVGAIARRVLAFGAPKQAPGAPPAPAPPAAELRPGKRLVRFNPQTGEPLPQPVWEDIPITPPVKK